MTYSAGDDPLCYPGSSVLVNRAGLKDLALLEQFKHAMFLLRFEENLPSGMLDYAHYKTLHRHLFQDVYEWAGETRSIRIGKNGNWFCFTEYIDQEMFRIFGGPARREVVRGMRNSDFSRRAAHLIAEINAVHPFREGNGCTQLTFLALLAENCGLALDGNQLVPSLVMSAMIESFAGRVRSLNELIEGAIIG